MIIIYKILKSKCTPSSCTLCVWEWVSLTNSCLIVYLCGFYMRKFKEDCCQAGLSFDPNPTFRNTDEAWYLVQPWNLGWKNVVCLIHGHSQFSFGQWFLLVTSTTIEKQYTKEEILQVEFKLTLHESIVYNRKPKLMIIVYHDLSAPSIWLSAWTQLQGRLVY